jgi:putative exosortase-associated protein (TIGR04073 family)
MVMKRTLFFLLVFAYAFSIMTPVSFAGICGFGEKKICGKQDPCSVTAASGLCSDDAWKKLGRGLANMLTFPLEIPNQISKTNNSDGPVAAFTWGLLKGVGMTGFRALVGVYETLTFPMPCPEGYKPILTEPEFFLEDQIC